MALGPINGLGVSGPVVDLDRTDWTYRDGRNIDPGDRVTFLANLGALNASAAVALPITLTADMTISDPLFLLPGALYTIPNGRTLTIAGAFSAPPTQVFNCIGTGRVVFNPGTVQCAYLEWWGVDRTTGEASVAFQQAVKSMARPAIQLLVGEYAITVTDHLGDRTGSFLLRGMGEHNTVVHTDSDSIAQLSLAGASADPASYQSDIIVEDIFFNRRGTPTVDGSSEVPGPNMACGLKVTQGLRVFIRRCVFFNDSVGAKLASTINVFLEDTYFLSPTTGPYIGLWIDSSSSSPTISPNASTSTMDIKINAPASSDSLACLIRGHISDQFLGRMESSGCRKGLLIWGLVGDANKQQVDIDITGVKLDGCTDYGVEVRDVKPYGAVNIFGGYCAVVAAGGCEAVRIVNSNNVYVSGGFEAVGIPGAMLACRMLNSTGCIAEILAIECSAGLGVIQNSQACHLFGTVQNVTKTGTNAVLVTSGSSYNTIDVGVTGAAGSFINGVNLDATSGGGNTVNPTRIVPGPATNRVVTNGVVVSRAGSADANGNVVIGNALHQGLNIGASPPTTADKLNVAGTTAGNIVAAFTDNAQASLYLRPTTSGFALGTDTGGVLALAGGGNALADIKATIDGNSLTTTGETALNLKSNLTGTAAFKRVLIGAVDSAGTGYRTLRVTN